ncbi:plasmid partitioning protein RepB C-terminal domain-containing protein [Acinetobacter sp. MD2(2019)]|uniref:plasmid partitioning protein RepB C-terminal domain-containing protein n=1 Tax=Acinetobacter sp. MD2(2019) TaxID=2605273 RepID=UPI002D1EA012|nr:plasmid partitioning protein RepB C-terminal domain-containing protein [Acinetobacter sp. MD2(2019)]MEB3755162.1 ParB N-terminal domain-containing protein [Acinetobacter sp. MD2(2019)]
MQKINIAFQLSTICIKTNNILSSKSVLKSTTYTKKYRQIKASIQEIGIIEPLIVTLTTDKKQYILLDGHIRFEILKELEFTEVPCIISSDNENYTYNKRINRLATIQEHFMIRRAIDQGVDKERLASALNIEIKAIRAKINLLNGICPEAIELLKDRELSPNVFSLLRKMKSIRQIECAELMISMNNLTVPYAKALLMTTPQNMLIEVMKPSKKNNGSFEAIKKMEVDTANIHLQIKSLEPSYAQDTLNLVLGIGYLKKMLANNNVQQYLEKNNNDIYSQFQSIIKLASNDF